MPKTALQRIFSGLQTSHPAQALQCTCGWLVQECNALVEFRGVDGPAPAAIQCGGISSASGDSQEQPLARDSQENVRDASGNAVS